MQLSNPNHENALRKMLHHFKKYITVVKIKGLLDGSKLGCTVGSSVGCKEGVVVGALEGLSASTEMPSMG